MYSIHTEADGTARVGARVQRSTSSAPAYIMTGSYQGYTNMRMQLESGNASIMTLPALRQLFFRASPFFLRFMLSMI